MVVVVTLVLSTWLGSQKNGSQPFPSTLSVTLRTHSGVLPSANRLHTDHYEAVSINNWKIVLRIIWLIFYNLCSPLTVVRKTVNLIFSEQKERHLLRVLAFHFFMNWMKHLRTLYKYWQASHTAVTARGYPRLISCARPTLRLLWCEQNAMSPVVNVISYLQILETWKSY
jgi:hypothetical protein